MRRLGRSSVYFSTFMCHSNLFSCSEVTCGRTRREREREREGERLTVIVIGAPQDTNVCKKEDDENEI